VGDTLGLLEEARQVAADLGYVVREEPLGDLPGGRCTVGGVVHVLLNISQSASDRLECLVSAISPDPRLATVPKSRLLEVRCRRQVRGEAAD